jgi:hypothetical protein
MGPVAFLVFGSQCNLVNPFHLRLIGIELVWIGMDGFNSRTKRLLS